MVSYFGDFALYRQKCQIKNPTKLLKGSYMFVYINTCRIPRKLFEQKAAWLSIDTTSERLGKC